MSILVTEQEQKTDTSNVRALVSIRVEPALVDHVAQTISNLPGIVQLYEATGDFDLITLITAPGIEEFRDILKNRIMKTQGVLNTGTAIVEEVCRC